MIKGLPDRLKELRKKNNYTQKSVANRIGVSPSIISAYETGERTPSLENILALSYLYQCSIDFLLGKTTESPLYSLDISQLNQEQIRAITYIVENLQTH